MNYWDTSALVKLYVSETDSHAFLDLAARQTETPSTSILTCVEMLVTLHRKEADHVLHTGQAQAIYARFAAHVGAKRISLLPAGFDCIKASERVVETAWHASPPVPIRSLDALHVATAIVGGARAIVTADARQRSVAAAMQLPTLPR
ncbi:MAG: type II toxin-antitoxin system VapC family toxin [Candidatus Xenobia bacterium]